MKTSIYYKDMDFNEWKQTLRAVSMLQTLDTRYDAQQKLEVLELYYHIKYHDVASYIDDRYDASINELLPIYFEDTQAKLILDSYYIYTSKSNTEAVRRLRKELNKCK